MNAARLRKYRDVVGLLVRHGGTDLLRHARTDARLVDEDLAVSEDSSDPAALARELERLGPTFIKFGQLLSTRSDLLPPAHLSALARLQDSVAPFPFVDVRRIVSAELGRPLSKIFVSFDREPLAAASLAQVHRARLRRGPKVAVKVQRPNIREQLTDDVEVIGVIAQLLEKYTATGHKYELRRTLEEYRKTLLEEIDFTREAQNMTLLANNLRSFDRIIVPEPIESYSARRVLTMEYVHGGKAREAADRSGVDGRALADELFTAYLQQILVDGFFHADPHPGNVVLTPDGRLALLDLGMIGRVSPAMQEGMLKLMLAISEGEAGDAADTAMRLSEPRDAVDSATFRQQMTDLVLRYRDASLKQIPVGRVVLEITRIAVDNGLRVVPELTLVAKTLLNLDEVARVLDPDFDPHDALRRNASRLIQRRLLQGLSPAHVFTSVLETKELVQTLPSRANRILDALARNDLRFKVEMIDEGAVIDGLQKVANRITVGLILAALILGAALLMRVDTPFRILGYPGLAILFFLAAAAGGLWLMFTIFARDRASIARSHSRR